MDFEPIHFVHQGAPLEGLVLHPEGEGRFPAVLVMANAYGLGNQVRNSARSLAALGYVAVVTDMYGGGLHIEDHAKVGDAMGLLVSAPEVLRARVVAWYEAAKAVPQVDPARIAAIGYCFGGKCVLELARSGADVKGVVSYHGLLTTDLPVASGTIKAHVMAFCGALDPYAPLRHIEGLRAELEAAQSQHTITIFGNAAHSFTDVSAGDDPSRGIAYHALSDRLSWAGTLALLETVLKC